MQKAALIQSRFIFLLDVHKTAVKSLWLRSGSLSLSRLRSEVEDHDDLEHVREVVYRDFTSDSKVRKYAGKYQRNDRFNVYKLSVDLLNYIYYPVIFTLSYSLVKNNISFGELAGFLGKLSAHSPYKEMLDTINLSKPASKPINPSFRNTETINRLFSESLYIIKRRYYRNTSPYPDYFLKTFYSADSPLKFPSYLIPSVLPRPARLNSDEYKTLLSLERK